MNKFKLTITAAMLLSAWDAQSFCGFYVAKIGTQLFNNKSEVILVRDGKNSTITMSNDFKGDVKDFAMVVPVPVVLRKDQIRITNRNVFARLGEYSSPRLVEYYDQNPCEQLYEMDDMVRTTSMESALEMMESSKNFKYGKNGTDLVMKIGIHYGKVLMGVIG